MSKHSRSLNPELLRMITPNNPNYELRLPAGTASRFLAEIADIPAEKWVVWRRHRVEEGETLTTIAHSFRVTPAAIAEANDLELRAPLEPGQKLIIPATEKSEVALGKLTYYKVHKGDTIQTVAEQFSVTSSGYRQMESPAGGQAHARDAPACLSGRTSEYADCFDKGPQARCNSSRRGFHGHHRPQSQAHGRARGDRSSQGAAGRDAVVHRSGVSHHGSGPARRQ